MSIAPAEGFPSSSAQSDNAFAGAVRPHASVAPQAASPVSGTPPKQETTVASNAPSAYELPQDVVEVHQDPDDKSRVIIQYLDKSGEVVIQVPSNQELSVERGIAQEFEQAAKLRATAGKETEGEKHHGD
ncbi:MAG: hypothetical protein ABSD75_30645 [Terriglobales bacterium]|jgi:hypothetical protein